MRSATNFSTKRFIRYASVLSLVVAFFMVALPAKATALSKEEVLFKINNHREDKDLAPLESSEKLHKSATKKLNHMIEHDYWDHYSEDGVGPWEFIRDAGLDYAIAGENLARGFTDEDKLLKAWMHSPTHRVNKLHDRYTYIGIALAEGTVDNVQTTVVVVHFAAKKDTARSVEIAASANNRGSQTVHSIASSLWQYLTGILSNVERIIADLTIAYFISLRHNHLI